MTTNPGFDTLILLTPAPERGVLAALMRRHNPHLAVLMPSGKAELAALPAATLSRARILGFLTPVIVPSGVLQALGYGAYNIHPGPPSYPGWLPSHVAVHEDAPVFGATAHVMVEEIDAGPIVGIEMFNVPPGTGIVELEKAAYVRCAKLIWRLAPALARDAEPLPHLPLRWSGRRSTRATVSALCRQVA